jgi:hypothetical protein
MARVVNAPVALGVALLLGIGAGAAAHAVGSSGKTEPVATTTKTVVREVAGPVVTVTAPPLPAKEVTKEVTPAACLRALDAGDTGFTHAAKALSLAGQGFEAIAEFDSDRLDSVNSQLEKMKPKMNRAAADWNTAKTACRSAAE